MADQELLQLDEDTSPEPGAYMYVVIDPDTDPKDRKVKLENIPGSGGGGGVQGVIGEAPIEVDNTDPANPVIGIDTTDIDADISGKVSKAGDEMTGGLTSFSSNGFSVRDLVDGEYTEQTDSGFTAAKTGEPLNYFQAGRSSTGGAISVGAVGSIESWMLRLLSQGGQLQYRGNGKLVFGLDQSVNLYPDGADVLRTDDSVRTVVDPVHDDDLTRMAWVLAQIGLEAALARNADNLTSGTVPDARIPSTIARDTEVTSAVAAEAVLARNADNLTSGSVPDARIPSTITRDTELSSAVSAEATLRSNADAAIVADLTTLGNYVGTVLPDPSSEPDNRWLRTADGGLEFTDAPTASTNDVLHDYVAGVPALDYVGVAPSGSATSSPVWDITRLTITSGGTTTVAHAVNVEWDDRLTEVYS